MQKLALFLTVLVCAYGDLIDNGGFEDNYCTSTYWCDYGPGNSIPGWSIDSGTVDIHASTSNDGTFFAHSGGWSVDVSGNEAGSISQTFATEVGHQYQVSFWLAGNPNCAPTIKTLQVSATGGSDQQYTFDETGKSITNPGWLPQTYSFVASSTSTTLSFVSLTYSSCGPAIDDISVADISTAATLCSQWTWEVDTGYFCSDDAAGFYMCLSGAFAPQSAYLPCAPGTTCQCAVGVECSGNGSPCS